MATTLQGAHAVLDDPHLSVAGDASSEDQAEEVESYQAALDVEQHTRTSQRTQPPAADDEDVDEEASGTHTGHYVLRRPNMDQSGAKRPKLSVDILNGRVKVASSGVIVKSTLETYERLWDQFTDFSARPELGWINDPDDMVAVCANTSDLPSDLPMWIAVWIMNKCDETDIFTGQSKDPTISRPTYAHAQKMRAAITHKFGRELGLGPLPWAESPLQPGKFTGNPSLSVMVAQYMVSLGRRKVRAGEIVTSARAMDESTMRKLYIYNASFSKDLSASNYRKRKAADPSLWAGHNIRIMLHLLYTISMICLLRYDEALRIRWDDIFIGKDKHGHTYIELRLPFRKTHQHGDIAPFVLYENEERPHLCVVGAYAEWLDVMDKESLERLGYMFRKRVGRDEISSDISEPMTSDAFLECFRNNLLDINVDPRPYGTHSFRRGGCQFLALVLRFPFIDICKWGGWASDFDNPGTIFKYLLSHVDTSFVERKDYFNPNRPKAIACHTCRRSCHCA